MTAAIETMSTGYADAINAGAGYRSEVAGSVMEARKAARGAIAGIAAVVPFLTFDETDQRLDVSIGSEAFRATYQDVATYEPSMDGEDADTHAYTDSADSEWMDWTEGEPLDAADLAEQLTSDKSIGLLFRATRREEFEGDEANAFTADAFDAALSLADVAIIDVRFIA